MKKYLSEVQLAKLNYKIRILLKFRFSIKLIIRPEDPGLLT